MMRPMTARELKNRTGDVLRALRQGETILLTYHGKVVGTIAPYRGEAGSDLAIRPYEEAWPEIERALRRTRPKHRTWREAEDRSRGRR